MSALFSVPTLTNGMVLLGVVDDTTEAYGRCSRSDPPGRDVVDVDRDDDITGVDAVGGVAWMDAMPVADTAQCGPAGRCGQMLVTARKQYGTQTGAEDDSG